MASRSRNATLDGPLVRYAKGVADPVRAGLDHVDYGLSVIDADLVRDRVPVGVRCDLAELQAQLADAGELAGFVADDRFYEIGSPAGLGARGAPARPARSARARLTRL